MIRPLTINQFAALHGRSRQRIWQLIIARRIPGAYRIGQEWLIRD